jgi:hypothetical protein
MDKMANEYADRAVSSVFLYTREAHPAENYRHHRSIDEKRDNAKAFRKELKVQRPILLDTLEGDAHKAFGMLPNMTWIIGRGGIIHYKAAWTDADHVAAAMEKILDDQDDRVEKGLTPFYCERLEWRVRDGEGFDRGLKRNGPQAMDDFYREARAPQ